MFAICWAMFNLKAPGNYSDHYWSNKSSVLLCEGAQHNISMISGFLSPGNPYLWILVYQITSTNLRKYMGPFSKTNILVNLDFYNVVNLGKDGH